MADLESVLADVSYLMTIEKSRNPGAKTIKKINLPDVRYCTTPVYIYRAYVCLCVQTRRWTYTLVA